MRMMAAAAVAFACLGGCSETPTTLANPRDSIMLQYDPGETSSRSVADVAQRHCESWGRNAVASRQERKEGLEISSFDCR